MTYSQIPKDVNRLITSLHPTGQVIFQDDFEGSLLKWEDTYVTAQGSIARSNANAFSGGYSLLITTAATANSQEIPRICTHLMPNKRLGEEIWFSIPTATNLGFIAIEFNEHDGSKLTRVHVKYDGANLSYINENGVYQVLGSVGAIYYGTSVGRWNNMKLIADFNKKEYVAAFFGNQVFDMKGIKLNNFDYSSAPYISWHIYLQTSANAAIIAYVDDVILTMNEP